MEKKRQKIRATVNDLNGFVMDGWAWGEDIFQVAA